MSIKPLTTKQPPFTVTTALSTMRRHCLMTQADLAELMKCDQAKISRLESTPADEIRIGDILNWCHATGHRVKITLGTAEAGSMDVKMP